MSNAEKAWDPYKVYKEPLSKSMKRSWRPTDKVEEMTRKIPETDVDILCSMKETPKAFIITAEIPGLEKEDVKVVYKDENIIIEGELKPFYEIDETKNEKEHLIERHYGKFCRKIKISENLVNLREMNWDVRNGLLSLTIPKIESNE